MLGPVFSLELLLGGRRGRQYVFRWLYGGWLVFLLFCWYVSYLTQIKNARSPWFHQDPWLVLSAHADSFIAFFLNQQYILILLLTPVYVAGGITDEKMRGTLTYLLTADLTTWDVIVGKLFGRLAQVATLFLTGLPVLAAVGAFGGLTPAMALAVLVTTAVPMFAIGALSLLASVWVRSTRDAVLAVYLVGAAAYFLLDGVRGLAPEALSGWAGTLQAAARGLDPLYVLEPTRGGDPDLRVAYRRSFQALLAWGVPGLVFVLLAAWRLRPAYTKQLESTGRASRLARFLPSRPAVGNDPIAWKTQYVEGVAPLGALKMFPRWAGVAAVFLLTTAASVWYIYSHLNISTKDFFDLFWAGDFNRIYHNLDPSVAGPFLYQAVVVMLLATFVIGVRTSGAVSGEREKQNWESLLLTPLETRQLTAGKLWGVLGAFVPYLTAYVVPAAVLAGVAGPIPLTFVLVSLGVTLLGCYFIGATGVWASVKSPTSWRALLVTLGFGYGGGFALFVITSPVTLVIASVLFALIAIIMQQTLGLPPSALLGGFPPFFIAFFVVVCVALVLGFALTAWWFIKEAERHVAQVERVKHWRREPGVRVRKLRRPLRAQA
jgi:ABC-type transport system involved in multi-copper enzyme maturation permease subunit